MALRRVDETNRIPPTWYGLNLGDKLFYLRQLSASDYRAIEVLVNLVLGRIWPTPRQEEW